MKRKYLATAFAGLMVFLVMSETSAQRGGRGGGGGRPGGGGGGFTAPARPAAPSRPAVPAPSAAPRTAAPSPHSTSGTGPGGGNIQGGSGERSYTTQGGSTITAKGAGVGGTTGGGTTGGKYLGGVQVTTPGGQTVNHVGKGGAATGPGGNTAANRAGVTGTNGPQGSGATASRGGVVSGAGGTAAYRGGVAVGPNGAGAARQAGAATANGTYYRSAAAVSGQGVAVRAGCSNYHSCFGGAWYAKYPGAWTAARWGNWAAWTAVAWNNLSSYCGYPAEPVSYDYGTSVVYQDEVVYVNGESVGTAEQYSEQAVAIADQGRKAEAGKDDEWQALGVFAMVKGDETTSSNIFQLAINKSGVIRGNYYNALTDSTEPVVGQVDKKSQRAAWTIGDKKTPTYEAGIMNLTGNETTLMVHYSKVKSQQFTLIRIERPEGDGANEPKTAP